MYIYSQKDKSIYIYIYSIVSICTCAYIKLCRQVAHYEVTKCAHKQTCPSQKGSTVRLSPSSAEWGVGGALAVTHCSVAVDGCVQCR